jgi:hypothetical protein
MTTTTDRKILWARDNKGLIGRRVRVVHGYGPHVLGRIADIVTNRWGASFLIFCDDGLEIFADKVIANGSHLEVAVHLEGSGK